ncbi:hypothetical protein EIP91_009322, partial [Steccherinum ochraceum]
MPPRKHDAWRNGLARKVRAAIEDHPDVPVIYQMRVNARHDLLPGVKGCNIYIATTDRSPAGLTRLYLSGMGIRFAPNIEKDMKMDEHNLTPSGWFGLRPGQYLMLRDPKDNGVSKKDYLYTVNADLTSPEAVSAAARFEEASREMLGPEQERTAGAAEFDDGPAGGVRFERVEHPKPVKKGSRCYSSGVTYQVPNQVVTPAADIKFSRGRGSNALDNDVRHPLRANVQSAGIEVAVIAMEAMPLIAGPIAAQHELLNLPPVGSPRNKYYPTTQFNISPAATREAHTKEINSLGQFGTMHEDGRDEVGALTALCSASHIPGSSKYHPGVFGFPEVMVFILLAGIACLIFSGLHLHGGTSPFPLEGQLTEENWPYRYMQVHYPTEGFFHCDGYAGPRFRLSNAHGGGFDQLRPQHQLVTNDLPSVFNSGSASSFIREGPVLIDRRSMVQFIVNAIILFACFLMHQLPAEYQADVDSDRIASAFSFVEGEPPRRVFAAPWKYAPRSRYQDDAETPNPDAVDDPSVLWAHRVAANDKYELHRETMRSGVPSEHASSAAVNRRKKELKVLYGEDTDGEDADGEDTDGEDDNETDDASNPQLIKLRGSKNKPPGRGKSRNRGRGRSGAKGSANSRAKGKGKGKGRAAEHEVSNVNGRPASSKRNREEAGGTEQSKKRRIAQEDDRNVTNALRRANQLGSRNQKRRYTGGGAQAVVPVTTQFIDVAQQASVVARSTRSGLYAVSDPERIREEMGGPRKLRDRLLDSQFDEESVNASGQEPDNYLADHEGEGSDLETRTGAIMLGSHGALPIAQAHDIPLSCEASPSQLPPREQLVVASAQSDASREDSPLVEIKRKRRAVHFADSDDDSSHYDPPLVLRPPLPVGRLHAVPSSSPPVSTQAFCLHSDDEEEHVLFDEEALDPPELAVTYDDLKLSGIYNTQFFDGVTERGLSTCRDALLVYTDVVTNAATPMQP